MAMTIDARGLACPEPVIRVKKALETASEIEAIVDNETALENVRRLASSSGCTERFEKMHGSEYRIFISKSDSCTALSVQEKGMVAGPTVINLSSDAMGRGDDNLGRTLMKAFVHTLTEIAPVPDVIILYNTGARLAIKDSQSADDLKILSGKGSKILVCGTCANFFEIKEQIAVGTISNMYDIAGNLVTAGRIVCP